MALDHQGPIRFPFYSQYDPSRLQSPPFRSGNCVADWSAASKVGDLAHAINGDPYQHWDFLERLPLYNHGLSLSFADGGRRIELDFPDPNDADEQARYQLARLLVDAKCAIYAFAGLNRGDGTPGDTRSEAARFNTAVVRLESSINRGNRWHGVSIEAGKAMTVLRDREAEFRTSRDAKVLADAKVALESVKSDLDVTMKGFQSVDGGMQDAIRFIDTLTAGLKSSCMQISSTVQSIGDRVRSPPSLDPRDPFAALRAAVTATEEARRARNKAILEIIEAIRDENLSPDEIPRRVQEIADKLSQPGKLGDPYIFDWAVRVSDAWKNNDMSQVDVWENGWSKIDSNLQHIKSTGSTLQKTFDDAVQATSSRISNPGATDIEHDALTDFLDLQSHTASQMKSWMQSVDEVLIINWQYVQGIGQGGGPIERLFMRDLDAVLGFPV